MSKSKIILMSIVTFVLILSLVISIYFRTIDRNKKEALEKLYTETMKEVDEVTIQIDAYLKEHPSLIFSATAYIMMEKCEAYKQIKLIGIRAIKPLYDKIVRNNESDGDNIIYLQLFADIYTIAIKDIMSQNFSDKFLYSKEFGIAFLSFMNKIPDEYKSIKKSKELNSEEKIAKISDLGLGVVPYLIEDIKEGIKPKNLYKKALTTILIERNQISSSKNISSDIENFDVKNWIKENQLEYELLREITNNE